MTSELRNEALVNEFLRKYRDLRKKKGLKVGDLITLYLNIEDKKTKEVLQEYVNSNFSDFNAKKIILDEKSVSDSVIEVMGIKIGVGII